MIRDLTTFMLSAPAALALAGAARGGVPGHGHS